MHALLVRAALGWFGQIAAVAAVWRAFELTVVLVPAVAVAC